ncbi:endoplasmic reticulum metallopeptidase 1-like, partial [Saccoglossus kowalevskii]|uniref:Endoplasmic reticulum metallopeptidase 1-like n=1 Tax=Saccoglossus kowalevskii TaxID=10224 RepID=A0ABM0N0F4_SACKO
HSIRKFHDISGSVWKEDSHLYIVPLDDNGLQHLLAAHPELKDAKAEHCVENAPYCGIAHYLPIGHMMRKSVWLPASPVNTIDPVQFKLVQNVKRTKSVRHLKFSLLGSERMTVYIQPKKGVLLTKWSLRGKIGKSADVSNDGVYFINYGHGYATSPWVFWIELDTTNAEDDGTDAILNIAVAAHHFHKDDVNKSKDLLKYLKKDPVWVTATKAISTYESWVF